LPSFAWAPAADRLTEWTLQRLVVHYDLYGSYEPRVVLQRHYRCESANYSIWLHPVSRGKTSKWFLITVAHKCDDPAQKAITDWQAASGWYEELKRRGFCPRLLDSNAGEDLQVLVILTKEVPSSQVFAYVQQLVSDYTERGLSQAPDIMPNQTDIDRSGDGGKRWRLPGPHDESYHFTRVWNGERWLEREEAIEMLLSVGGDPPELVTGIQETESAEAVAQATA
jgi:hypothetical protein